MPYKYVPADVFLSYEGIDIYYTYQDDRIEAPMSMWFARSPDGTHDGLQQGEFDVSRLPNYDYYTEQSRNTSKAAARTIIDAIEAGMFAEPWAPGKPAHAGAPDPAQELQQSGQPQGQQGDPEPHAQSNVPTPAKVQQMVGEAHRIANESHQAVNETIEQISDQISDESSSS